MARVYGFVLAVAMALGLAQGFVIPGGAPRASRCAAGPLQAVREVKSAEEFDSMVGASAGKLVVVDYSTTWCGPCKMMAPKFDELSDKYDNAVFAKVIGDSCAEAGALLKREGVRSVPAFHFWKGGKRVDTMSGADPEKLEATIVDNV